MRVGIADHFGWAVAVTASPDHEVIDRRRIELVEPGVTPAPIHYDGKDRPLAEVEALVAEVRASVRRATDVALDALADDLPGPILSVSIRQWPADFPTDVATQLLAPHEARADGVMYRQILAEAIEGRGWTLHRYDHRVVERAATDLLGDRADHVLHGPRARLGAPWSKDHRVALAATILAAP
jgi:hypothetical protein